jgi:rhamnulokinase
MTTVAAIDLGASSGRVVLGHVSADSVRLEEVHRFPNEPVRLPTGLQWDVARLWHEVVIGLGAAARSSGDVRSVGVDTWAIDFGLVDKAGELLGPVAHYRDNRTDGIAEQFDEVIPRQDLYERNGLQLLSFTTLYQLLAIRGSAALAGAHRLLLVPDLMGHWLSGVQVTEQTNASTTGLLDVRTQQWAPDLVTAAGLYPALLAPLVEPGDVLGALQSRLIAETGLSKSAVLTAVGSTPHRRWSARRWTRSGRPTSRAGRGRWSVWSWSNPCSPRQAGSPGSPTRAVSTGGSAICTT